MKPMQNTENVFWNVSSMLLQKFHLQNVLQFFLFLGVHLYQKEKKKNTMV